jgi:hypothetical protein
MLTLLGEIMQGAVDYGYVQRNPFELGKRSDRVPAGALATPNP